MKNQDHRCPKCGNWWNELRECDYCSPLAQGERSEAAQPVCSSRGLGVSASERQPDAVSVAVGREESGLPAPEICVRLLKARDALIFKSGAAAVGEAFHQLYAIADPTFESREPWKRMEAQAALASATASERITPNATT